MVFFRVFAFELIEYISSMYQGETQIRTKDVLFLRGLICMPSITSFGTSHVIVRAVEGTATLPGCPRRASTTSSSACNCPRFSLCILNIISISCCLLPEPPRHATRIPCRQCFASVFEFLESARTRLSAVPKYTCSFDLGLCGTCIVSQKGKIIPVLVSILLIIIASRAQAGR